MNNVVWNWPRKEQYKCARCKKEYEKFGGYAVTEMKDLCSECWGEYIEMVNRHNRELNKWWSNERIR